MPPTQLNPSQIHNLEELIERVTRLEAENQAQRCVLKGFASKYYGAKVGKVAHEEADKLDGDDKELIKRLIDEMIVHDI